MLPLPPPLDSGLLDVDVEADADVAGAALVLLLELLLLELEHADTAKTVTAARPPIIRALLLNMCCPFRAGYLTYSERRCLRRPAGTTSLSRMAKNTRTRTASMMTSSAPPATCE